ncbi:probable E3 ubiquitin-protein ligase HERC4 [Watersipora subatra]|uniref:probable E3 ubiquitin-protein ligase HERC4 n=1 Tax=Watersipora subatra TaxID=2589382 RepID=UPI00355C319A
MDENGEIISPKIYVWGQTGNHQLNIEPNDMGYLVEPAHMDASDHMKVLDVALGLKHSLLLTDKGLMSVGCNTEGQLGWSPSQGSFAPEAGLVRGLPDCDIKAIAVGEAHSLVLTSKGALYSFGGNACGQLGHDNSSNPGKVMFPVSCEITQIACGEYHNIALAKCGDIYTWGANQYGQLGHGYADPFLKNPTIIKTIRSLHFVKIAAGDNHSFALTVSGALFGWGRNSNGQLGVKNTENRLFPVCCRALRQQGVKHIACGLAHTAVLTKEGGVFTFGAGNHGQLGHALTQDEHLPRKVQELMGTTVTQLSCGRYHTLAYAPSNGRVYSFGLGSYGQLGVGNTDKKTTPHPVKPVWTANSTSPPYSVNRIIAGGNGCLIYAYPQHFTAPSIDHRVIISTQRQLDTEFINNLLSAPQIFRLDPLLDSAIQDVFKNVSVWNGAFLASASDAKDWCCKSRHGIDLDLAREQLSRISECKSTVVQQLVMSNTEQHLAVYIKGTIPDVEALRIFLILPFLSMFNDPGNFATLHSNYGTALVNMDTMGANVLDIWLQLAPIRHFKYYLFTFKRVVGHILSMGEASTEYEAMVRQSGIYISLKVMKRLHKINETEREDQRLSCADFYIPEITDHVNIKQDYHNWYNQTKRDEKGRSIVHFCDYVFAFDAQAKTVLLQTDAHLQMQKAIDQAHMQNLYHIFSSDIDLVHPCLVLNVSRSNIVHDTLVSLNLFGSTDLKKPLKVQFKGEEAVDEGGVRKEFFLLLIKEVLDVKYGMFTSYPESGLQWFNSQTFEEDMSMFHLIGVLCGLAIYNITIISLPFPIGLYKKLLDKPVNLDDLRELDPLLGKNLQELLDYDEMDVADAFGLFFTISMKRLDEVVTMDLKEDGSNIPVTHENRQEYVNLYVSYIFNESVQRMFDAFYEGFHKVCGSKVLRFFHPAELQAMVVGNENYDWVKLKENCSYKGEYYADHPTIKYFWETFFQLSESELKNFLRFLTGCDRIPTQGMESLKMVIQPMSTGDDHLPVAHTCFNLLDLPKYSSKDILRSKLLTAIEHSEGFGLV